MIPKLDIIFIDYEMPFLNGDAIDRIIRRKTTKNLVSSSENLFAYTKL